MGSASRLVSWDSRTPIGKVMVVDDEALVRMSVTRLLAHSGFEVIQASDGLDAVEQYQADQDGISLVIMDIVMPRLGGIEAAKKIRAINPAAKVILTDGRPEAVPAEATPNAFLRKPFRLGSFCEVVQEVLRVERRRGEPGQVAGSSPP